MTILITGGDGYLGWPTTLRIASRTDDRVVVVDNFSRRRWVEEVGSVSAAPIYEMDVRIKTAQEVSGNDSISFVQADLTDRTTVDKLLRIHEPNTVVHTAAQPSAPYSQISGERANYTQSNNLESTRHLLWGLHENNLNDTHFIETTTTGIYGSPEFPIPEGGAIMKNQGEHDDVPFPAMGGSWYHLTKCYDAANMRLANQQFGIPISDVRTAIIYGSETSETRSDEQLTTRFDFDYYFGTVAHRFCAQAVAGYPMTVYGKGKQRKPFISLEDAVEGLTRLALKSPEDRRKSGDHHKNHVVYNQVTRAISIQEIASTIAEVGTRYGLDVSVEHFENPRDENETHEMEIENDKYKKLIDGQSETFEQSIDSIFNTLLENRDRIESHEDRFLPDVLKSMN